MDAVTGRAPGLRLTVASRIARVCVMITLFTSLSGLSGAATAITTKAQLRQQLEQAASMRFLPQVLDLPLSKSASDDFSVSGISGFDTRTTGRDCLVDFRAATAQGDRPKDAQCTFGDQRATRLVVLYGDSHAAMWLPALNLLGSRQHFRVILLARASCFVAAIRQWVWATHGPSSGCDRWKHWSVEHLTALHPDVVVVTDDSNAAQRDPSFNPISPEVYARAETKTLKMISAPGRKVIVIGRTPSLPGPAPQCLAKNSSKVSRCATSVKNYTAMLSPFETIAATKAGATFVSPKSWLCATRVCPAIVGSTVVYADEQHVSRTFATTIANVVGMDLHAAGL